MKVNEINIKVNVIEMFMADSYAKSKDVSVVLYPFSYLDYYGRVKAKYTIQRGTLFEYEHSHSSYINYLDQESGNNTEYKPEDSPEEHPELFKGIDMDATIDNCFKNALKGIEVDKDDVFIDAVLIVPQSAFNRIHSYEALMLHYFKMMNPDVKVRISLVALKPLDIASVFSVEIKYISFKHNRFCNGV